MVRLPKYDDRTAVIGSTGSGKTQFAVWLLSNRDLNARPWIIFDFKGDDLIAQIGAIEISIFGGIPKQPGLYVVRPIPELHDDAVKDFLWKIWRRENVGIYIDEGYMLGTRNPALNACLTQGRSKHIEMIVLSQRPVWMSKFVFSESTFFAIFNLTLEDDRKFVSGYVGGQSIKVLPRFNCLWYDVNQQQAHFFKPVPSRDEIIATFEAKLANKRKAI